jgi:hypothetical protein
MTWPRAILVQKLRVRIRLLVVFGQSLAPLLRIAQRTGLKQAHFQRQPHLQRGSRAFFCCEALGVPRRLFRGKVRGRS